MHIKQVLWYFGDKICGCDFKLQTKRYNGIFVNGNYLQSFQSKLDVNFGRSLLSPDLLTPLRTRVRNDLL